MRIYVYIYTHTHTHIPVQLIVNKGMHDFFFSLQQLKIGHELWLLSTSRIWETQVGRMSF